MDLSSETTKISTQNHTYRALTPYPARRKCWPPPDRPLPCCSWPCPSWPPPNCAAVHRDHRPPDRTVSPSPVAVCSLGRPQRQSEAAALADWCCCTPLSPAVDDSPRSGSPAQMTRADVLKVGNEA